MNLDGLRDALARAADVFRAIRPQRSTARGVATSDPASAGRFLALSFGSEAGTRAYKVFVPSGYGDALYPLVIMLHGCKQTPDDFAAGTRMNALAEAHTFLVVYPEQSTSANLQKCWNWFEPRNQQRDLGEPSLVAGITRAVMQSYAIDPKRVYVAGMSAGGAAAAVLGATYPDLYAAIGVHSGIAPGLAEGVISGLVIMETGEGASRADDSGPPDHPIPTIVFQGDCDATVNPRNAERFSTAFVSTACSKQTQSGQVPAGRAFTQTTFRDARGHDVHEQWSIHGMGHGWSGGSELGSYTDPLGPDASREFVRFFFSHRLPSRVDAEAFDARAPGGARRRFDFWKSRRARAVTAYVDRR